MIVKEGKRYRLGSIEVTVMGFEWRGNHHIAHVASEHGVGTARLKDLKPRKKGKK